ncbi:MAG: hypothetical protein ABIJ94_02175 [candidate division WOR-3 bacterium]
MYLNQKTGRPRKSESKIEQKKSQKEDREKEKQIAKAKIASPNEQTAENTLTTPKIQTKSKDKANEQLTMLEDRVKQLQAQLTEIVKQLNAFDQIMPSETPAKDNGEVINVLTIRSPDDCAFSQYRFPTSQGYHQTNFSPNERSGWMG